MELRIKDIMESGGFTHEKYLDSVIDFYENDAESCFETVRSRFDLNHPEKMKKFPGSMALTIGLLIFCVIEVFSSYYVGKKATDYDIALFMGKYFSKYNRRFNNKDFCKSFFNVFRHGLVHNWAPKNGVLSINFGDQRFLKIETLGEGVQKIDRMIINLVSFFDLTQKAFQDYKEDLKKGLFVREFNKRFEDIIEKDALAEKAFIKYYSESEKEIKILKK